MISYERFKELWNKYVKNHNPPNALVDNGSPIANAELIKFAEGKPSAFDQFLK